VNNFWKDEPLVSRGLEQVQSRIEQTVSGARGFIRPYLQQLLTQQGKMLRPACVLLSSRAEGAAADEDETADLAAGVELIHTASLIHDDIIDEAPLRRGESTLHSRIGNRKAVVAGDYLMAKAFSLFSSVPADRIRPQVVSDRIGRLCESEIDQDGEMGDFSISIGHYLRRIGGKTAALFSLSCYLGAASSNLSRLQQHRLSRFGYTLGMAFQIQDDILDYRGDERHLGKETARDLQAGIATLPLLCALQNDSSGALAQLLKSHPVRADEACDMVLRLGGPAEAESIAEAYHRRARRELSRLPAGEASVMLGRLLDRLTGRSR